LEILIFEPASASLSINWLFYNWWICFTWSSSCLSDKII